MAIRAIILLQFGLLSFGQEVTEERLRSRECVNQTAKTFHTSMLLTSE